MGDAALALRQVRFENRAFWRNPAAAFFTFAFPLMFLVIFNLLFGDDPTGVYGQGEVSGSTFYVPAIAAFSVITACFTNVAIQVTFARDEGILKRVRGTPLPQWGYLFGKIAHATLIAVLLVVIVVAFGALLYDVDVPGRTMPAFALSVMAGAAAFCALGLAMTGFIPNAEASPPITNAVILPLLFISGIFIPLDRAPGWLVTVADLFPVKHFADALLTSFSPFERGSGIAWADLAILGAWGIAGALIAARFFTWEPRR